MKDACPDKPEDFDLHEDTDGCPDLDDDGDGVPDEKDNCFDLPGLPDHHGCPDEDCVIVTDVDDCWLAPIWYAGAPANMLDLIAASIRKYPEIREITLRTQQTLAQTPGTARARLEHLRDGLVARGLPAKLFVLTEQPPADPRDTPREDVFAEVTKQRFGPGKFRETLCADDMGTLYRVSREHNYGCKPSVCGNGRCGAHEDSTNCPQDCPP